ncbi:polysaccharide biosynthesis protein [Arthrobacter mobilis]|uniref:Polysaccharide biosynthesis protein n=1 Tax=Arthrobacter mobilis TaxID=2724944 RepID=A0A7X6HDQ6_9MICC|nr:nucleoside-diphosphate sugar epimerase/dehydratase [Arthrobacter mobilis]NKX54555.1 polysaccharide biosynthesis protein [Arthrobacter mobilis]
MTSGTTSSLPRTASSDRALWLWSQVLLDAFAWIVAIALAMVLRYEASVDPDKLPGVVAICALAVAAQVAVGSALALYRGRYSFGSFHEAKLLVIVAVSVTVIVTVALLFFGIPMGIARGVGLIAFPFACLFMAAIRYLKRMYVESKAKPGETAERTLVYGAGFVGTSIVTRMSNDRLSPWRPVGLIDDDPAKKHLRISSVPVLGTVEDLPEVVRRTGATVLLVAIANVDAKHVRRISDTVAGLNMKVLVVPPLKKMLTAGANFSFRELAIEDLIGRQPVDIHVEEIAHYVTGKRVLVTGAGGSIGSELCRQIHEFAPSELIMLDRDESGLQATQISITGQGLLTGQDTVLADIRDPRAVSDIFRSRRPEVVFHAAALKHVSLLEQYPEEAWKTNVLGSLNVLNAAREAGVQTFVNISTDKAANPTTVLGHSKRVAEKLTAWVAHQTGRKYVSVRFGNVLGSRGSVLPLFTEQIRKGGPVTVTDPEATRFFMTIPEACQLVIQAGAIGRGGEVLILDMGEPVRILDVARRMIELSGKDIDIVFTGLRQGEKLHEDLVGDGEDDSRPLHPKISHASIEPLDPSDMSLQEWKDRQHLPGPPAAAELAGPARPLTPHPEVAP